MPLIANEVRFFVEEAMRQKWSLANTMGVLLICLALSPSAPAQIAGGSVSGVVTGPEGKVVPNASVTILNLGTGVTRNMNTNESGFYSAPNLVPGPYQVAASASGFVTIVEKLELKVSSETVVNIQLKVGQVSERVEIVEEPPAVDQTSSTLSATVQSKTIRELPLNGRDWTQLAALEPGVN